MMASSAQALLRVAIEVAEMTVLLNKFLSLRTAYSAYQSYVNVCCSWSLQVLG